MFAAISPLLPWGCSRFLPAPSGRKACSPCKSVRLPLPAPPTPLLNHSDIWNFFKPTNGAPMAGWQTVADGALAGWGSAPGGFGYGDPNIANTAPGYESTTLSDMINR